MRYDVNSNGTKTAIANSLKKLVKEWKSGDRITINKIVSNCQVNRNTFYYHFSDIQDLILWILHNDFSLCITGMAADDGASIRAFVVDYLFSNLKFLSYSCSCLGEDMFRKCYSGELAPIIAKFISSYERENNIAFHSNFKDFMVSFFSDQIASLYMIQFHYSPDANRRFVTLKSLEMMFDYAIPHILMHEKDLDFSGNKD